MSSLQEEIARAMEELDKPSKKQAELSQEDMELLLLTAFLDEEGYGSSN